MATAHFVFVDKSQLSYQKIEDLSMQPPYWMIKYKKDDGIVREFISFNSVDRVQVVGEEELIARARVGSPEKLARDLGIE